jgi:hypothetical protein
MGLYSGSASAYACTDFAYDYIDFVSRSYESYELELPYEEESTCEFS